MRHVNGWYVPESDHYFDRFLEGKPYKQNGFQREHLLEAFKHVTKWDYAVDVGAHVGFWAKDMADKFGKVYCFEPSPETFSCLAKNLADYDNVELACCAVGDKPGNCVIQRDALRNSNSGSEFITKNQSGPIRMVSLDTLGLPGCDFLKVDVEGFESMVLRGAKNLIAQHCPVIIMETDKKFSASRYRIPNTEAEHFLLKRGYSVVAHMRPDKVFVAQPVQ